MGNRQRCFVLVLFMMASPFSLACAAGSNGGETAVADTLERERIHAGLMQLGIAQGYVIVVGDRCDRVETTAAEMMQRFLGKASVRADIVPESQAPGGKRILLGRESSLKAIKDLGDKDAVTIRDVSALDDGFHLKRVGKDIVVAGANPRGVLYGVYAFEDFVNAGANGDVDIKKAPYYRKRGGGLNYVDVMFYKELEEFPEEKAAGLSRLGMNQMTDQGISGHLSRYVHSDVFPFQEAPNPDYQRKIKSMSTLCAKYGIDMYIFLQEPGIDKVSGGYDSYPKDALGQVRPPWGVPNNGTVPTLCINSPIVQEHLRQMMRKLVREYPDLKGVQLYNLDIATWLCTPELCERCKKVVSDSPQGEFNPWETQAKLVTLLSQAAHEERPDSDVRFWGAIHYEGERFDKLIHATKGFSSVMSSWTGSDRSIMVPDAAQRTASCIMSQAQAQERGIPFYMVGEYNNMEVVPTSLSFPFHVSDSLKKYKKWDVRNLAEIFGAEVAHNSINALVTREFEWNPDQNAETFLEDLSRRQFGQAGGRLAYASWEEVRKAFNVWNDEPAAPFPLVGSQFHTKLGTAVGGVPPVITPEGAKTYGDIIGMLDKVEVWLAESYRRHKTPGYADKMERMGMHLTEAAKLAKQAIGEASDQEFIELVAYEGPQGRPTRRQYAELNWAPMAMADSFCRQRCNLMHACLLLEGISNSRASGDAKSGQEKENSYRKLIQEDLKVQESFLELLTQFSAMQPVLTRTSLTEKELSDFSGATRTKIRQLKEYLAKASS